MTPVTVRLDDPTALSVLWDDNHAGHYPLYRLRAQCPCAGCRHEVEVADGMIRLPVLTPGQNDLVSIVPVGSYALQFAWRDGHRTGIYTFEYLRSICGCSLCNAPAGKRQ